MTGSIRTPVPGEHPDQDLLADLAAEVLPVDLATDVQNHVIGCPICANLLAEAEGIRSLLRQSPTETMPPQVLARLEQAMFEATHQDEAPPEISETSTRLMRPIRRAEPRPDVTGALPAGAGGPATGASRRITRSGPSTTAIPTSGQATGALPTSRLNRMTRPTQGARRQLREEARADRPSRWGPILRIAAVVVVVLGVGGVLVQLLGGSSDSGDSAASSAPLAAGGAAPILAPVQSTDTNYQKSDLSTQVKALITSSQQLVARPSGEADLRAKADSAKPESTTGSAGSSALSSPATLRACLNGIGAGQTQPVAIDLARYAGQEAAILVLPADDGSGYDVWVVSRDCSAGSTSTIAVEHVDS
jgi:hypothetical protein